MYELTPADQVWNRACFRTCEQPGIGDRAIADLLKAHGLVMNGGVLHAVECLSQDDLDAAASGYRFFGIEEAGAILLRARQCFEQGHESEELELSQWEQYLACVPDDQFLAQQFEARLSQSPSDFAPL